MVASNAFVLPSEIAVPHPAPDRPSGPDARARQPRKVGVRAVLYMMLGGLDAVSIISGFAAASFVRLDDSLSGQVAAISAVLIPVYLAVLAGKHGLCAETLADWKLGVKRALASLMLAGALLVAVGFGWKVSHDYSRAIVLLGLPLSALLLVFGRALSRPLLDRALGGSPLHEIVLCDGVAPPRDLDCPVVHAPLLQIGAQLDRSDNLERIGQALGAADRVIVACAPGDRAAWSAVLKGLGIEVEILVPELDELGVLATARRGASLTAVVSARPLRLTQRVMKRAFDLAVALWLLPAVLLVTAVVAILIKLDDGGPIFFAQRRLGQGNRLFKVYKFRSMRVELADEKGDVSTARRDPRVTRVGRFLRSTSVDELPQLFNVLRGDMSIVGPRPHALGSTAGERLFWAVDQRYWWRHAIKPGLTGLAQVRGFRGATASEADLTNRVQADLEYLSGWSLLRDIKIILLTLRVILHPNAY